MIYNKTITSLLHLSDYVKQNLNGRTFVIKKCHTILSNVVYSVSTIPEYYQKHSVY